MLRPRIIPCLLIQKGNLVKTRGFGSPKYVGDPINAVRTFNEKEVDELIILDIDATVGNHAPNYELISRLAAECRMPLCYGGGVKSVEQVDRIISLGVEKVAISSAALADPALVSNSSSRVGSQSIVVVLDVKKAIPGFCEVVTHNGRVRTGRSPVPLAKEMQALGVGEIVINSVERDGEMLGYDLELASEMRDAVTVPITMLGGAGSHGDIEALISKHGAIGAAAGSLFVFKGKYRAVLINYPDRTEKDALLRRALESE